MIIFHEGDHKCEFYTSNRQKEMEDCWQVPIYLKQLYFSECSLAFTHATYLKFRLSRKNNEQKGVLQEAFRYVCDSSLMQNMLALS